MCGISTAHGTDETLNLGDNFVQEGLVNRITPFTTNKPGAKNFDVAVLAFINLKVGDTRD